MVITTPFITKSILGIKPWSKLLPSTASDITITVREKGLKGSWSKNFKDLDVMNGRITIGRVRNSLLQIDDGKVSRLHAVVECSPTDGKWTFQDVQSQNGSILNGKTLKPKTPHELNDKDKIIIGKYRWKLCHMLEISIHYLVDDLPKEEKPPPPRKLTWRHSLFCNACMGYGPRHSCTMRVSILRKMILDAHRKSNVSARAFPKTMLQKAQMRRLSYWWAKKPGEDEKKDVLEVPKRYNDAPAKSVRELPNFEDDKQPSTVVYPMFNPNLSI